MKIQNFSVEYFRSINELKFDLSDSNRILCLVGKNESGKTSILQAIAWVGNAREYKLNEKDLNNSITDEEKTLILNNTKPIAELECILTNAEYEAIFGLQGIENTADENVIQLLRFFNGNYQVIEGDKKSTFLNHQELIQKLTDFPIFAYYDAFNEYIFEDEMPWGQLFSRPAWQNLANVLGINNTRHTEISSLISAQNVFELNKIQEGLSADLSTRFGEFWRGKTKRVQFLINSGKAFVVCDAMRPSQMSSGFKWAFSLNVKLQAIQNSSEKRPLILLIDEPNNTLDGDQQYAVVNYFQQFCQENNATILYSTHSPYMISLDLPLFLVESDKSTEVNKLITLKDEDLASLRGVLGLKLMHAIRYNKILLVEGLTDKNHLVLWDNEKKLQEAGISIETISGANYIIEHLEKWKREGLLARVICLFDTDKAGQEAAIKIKGIFQKDEHPKIIFSGEDGIEDCYSREDYNKILGKAYGAEVAKSAGSKKTKEIISITGDKPEIFKLKFLLTARELKMDFAEQTKKNFVELIDKIILASTQQQTKGAKQARVK